MPLKRAGQDSVPTVPVVRILESPQLTPEELPSLLREINERQWGAVLEVLIEAKMKAEAVLRNDAVFDSLGRSHFYQGWVAYADYIIGSLVSLRSEVTTVAEQAHPGPQED
jgi:hypothetical protein